MYHMTKESPTGVQKGTIQLMSNTTEKLTHYGSIPLINEYLNETDRPCGIRLLYFMKIADLSKISFLVDIFIDC